MTRLGPYAVAGAVGATLARLGDGPVRLARAVAVLERAPLITAARLAGIDPERGVGVRRAARARRDPARRPPARVRARARARRGAERADGGRARPAARDAARILGEAGAAPEAVAVHLLHAEPRGDEAVAHTLAEAGRRALASGALTEAAALLARALAEPPPPASARRCCWTSRGRSTGSAAPRRSTACSRRPTPPLDEVDRAAGGARADVGERSGRARIRGRRSR